MNLYEVFISVSTAYLFVYLYGLATLSLFFSTLRAIAEHQVNYVNSKEEDKGVLRNLKCNFLTKLVFGSYGFSEHATHHKFPSIPSYSLKKLTNELVKDDSELIAHNGYINIILELIFKDNSRKNLNLDIKSYNN